MAPSLGRERSPSPPPPFFFLIYTSSPPTMAASRMISRATPTHKNTPSAHHHHHFHPSVPEDAVFEFDESDLLWSSNDDASSDPRKPQTRSLKKLQWRPSATETSPTVVAAASSLPVNIPDWSKILQGDYRGHHLGIEDAKGGGSDGDEEDDGDRVPPHELLARRRGASLSVHEGFGRTLKGRDLRRVRNAIWKKVGFED